MNVPSPTRAQVFLVGLVALALVIAWLIRFGTDDAFISFNYSRALVRGDGLTWFGDRIEGYTNFLWVLWVALGIAIGVAPLMWAWIGSLASLAVATVMTYRLARLRGSTEEAALTACALLIVNFTFLAYGTSGLETMLQCALFVIASVLVERARETPTPQVLATFSLVAALALMTRLDSAVVLAVLGVTLVVRLARVRAAPIAYIATVVPVLVLVGGWFAWKLIYYGDLVPNTFHVKVGLSSASVANGLRYTWKFLHSYLLWPFVLLVVAVAVARRRSPGLPAIGTLVWLAYVVLVGGDFMEFRFFVPIMPLLFITIADVIALPVERLPAPRLRSIAAVAITAALSWRHAATFETDEQHSYDSVTDLGSFYGEVSDNNWAPIGSGLHNVLAGTGASLACQGAGAVPYYADLPTIDQLGLNDAWVARNGARPPYSRPGHQRFAPYEYLVEKHVTFVIGSPTLVSQREIVGATASSNAKGWLARLLGPAPLPNTEMLVALAPIDDSHALLLWYLTPTQEVTKRIQAAHWRVWKVNPEAPR